MINPFDEPHRAGKRLVAEMSIRLAHVAHGARDASFFALVSLAKVEAQ